MANPIVVCRRCGKLVNTKNGKMKDHKAKGTSVKCIGSGEKVND